MENEESKKEKYRSAIMDLAQFMAIGEVGLNSTNVMSSAVEANRTELVNVTIRWRRSVGKSAYSPM